MPNGGLGFNAKIVARPTVDALKELDKRVDRATMYTLRAIGRKVKQAARRNAPVFRDRTDLMGRVFTYAGKQVVKNPGDGMLKNSISSSRQMRHEGRSYSITVGPHGFANFYASKQEARTPYMGPARDAAMAEAPVLYEKAMASVIRNAGRR